MTRALVRSGKATSQSSGASAHAICGSIQSMTACDLQSRQYRCQVELTHDIRKYKCRHVARRLRTVHTLQPSPFTNEHYNWAVLCADIAGQAMCAHARKLGPARDLLERGVRATVDVSGHLFVSSHCLCATKATWHVAARVDARSVLTSERVAVMANAFGYNRCRHAPYGLQGRALLGVHVKQGNS